MDPFLIPIIGTITTMTAVILVTYFITKYSHLTKKVIVENGGDYTPVKKKRPWIEMGMTLMGAGLGLFFGLVLTTIFDQLPSMITPSLVLFFAGAFMVGSPKVRAKLESSEGK